MYFDFNYLVVFSATCNYVSDDVWFVFIFDPSFQLMLCSSVNHAVEMNANN